jgi:hypothetical protein
MSALQIGQERYAKRVGLPKRVLVDIPLPCWDESGSVGVAGAVSILHAKGVVESLRFGTS